MYREQIEKLAPGYDPAHIEGYMLFERSVPDALSPTKFDELVKRACQHIQEDGLEMADRFAIAYGLRPKKRKATT